MVKLPFEVRKPPVRKMFLPDPDHFLIEVDLKQADAQIVACEAFDEPLLDLFRAQRSDPTIDIHVENARVAYGTSTISLKMRQISKSLVHGTNYLASVSKLAKTLGLLQHQVSTFQRRWFAAHPAIPRWHTAIAAELAQTRGVRNVYGYRITFFGRIDTLLPEALAWKPQSTVALYINKGIERASKILALHPLLQVHDSGLFQAHRSAVPIILQQLPAAFNVPLPYPWGEWTIPVDIKISDLSWGDCHQP